MCIRSRTTSDSALEDPLDFRRWIGPCLVSAIGCFPKDKMVTVGSSVRDTKGRYSGVLATGTTTSNTPTKTDYK